MSFNTGLSFEIYDLAGLAGGDGDDDSLVDDVVDVLVEAMGDEEDADEQHEDQEHYHVHGHGLGGTGGEQTGDTAEQPSHGSLHHLVNVSVAGSIPSAGQNF